MSAPLQSLAKNAANLLRLSRATSTSSCYEASFNRFKSWCLPHGLPFLPTNSGVIALYLSHLSNTNVSFGVINVAYYSILFFHQINVFACPRLNLTDQILEGCKRKLVTKAINQKLPLPLSVFHTICSYIQQ